MTTALVLAALVLPLLYGLDRNHACRSGALAGSTDVVDRDRARLAADLRAAVDRAEPPELPLSARRAATVRPASATR